MSEYKYIITHSPHEGDHAFPILVSVLTKEKKEVGMKQPRILEFRFGAGCGGPVCLRERLPRGDEAEYVFN